MLKLKNEIKWYNYAVLALIAFLVMMSYFVVLLLIDMELVSFERMFMSLAMWGAGSVFILFLAKKTVSFSFFSEDPKPSMVGFIICTILAVVVTALMGVLWGGLKPYLELQAHLRELGGSGSLYFVLQIVYYFFEMFIALMIVVFAQKALELLTLKKKVPWGGIILGLTWGLVHIFTQNDIAVGLVALVLGVLLGLPYLLLNRNVKWAWLFMALIFI